MTVEGSLDLFQLPEILQTVAQQRKTGILTVQGPDDIVAVSFLDGAMVAADSLNQPSEEALAGRLVERGLIDDGAARRLVEAQALGEGRLMDAVVEEGLVERPALLEVLRDRTVALLLSILGWGEGEFKFYGGNEVAHEEGFRPIGVDELLLRAGEAGVRMPERPAPDPVSPPAPGPASAPESETADDLDDGFVFEPPPRKGDGASAPAPEPSGPVAVGDPPLEDDPARAERRPSLRVPAAVGLLWAGVATALVVAVLLLAPGAVHLPFPWQAEERGRLLSEWQTSRFLEIDRAAKTHFLLEGRFPDRLDRLAELALLDRRDLVSAAGEGLAYEPAPASYALTADLGSETLRSEEGIAGDFLLDPELERTADESVAQPLVLLD